MKRIFTYIVVSIVILGMVASYVFMGFGNLKPVKKQQVLDSTVANASATPDNALNDQFKGPSAPPAVTGPTGGQNILGPGTVPPTNTQ